MTYCRKGMRLFKLMRLAVEAVDAVALVATLEYFEVCAARRPWNIQTPQFNTETFKHYS